MNSVEVKILNCLKDHSGAVSCEELAEACGVSKSTVRSRISGLNVDLRKNGVCISAKPAAGYQLCVRDPEKAASFFTVLQEQTIRLEAGAGDEEYRVNFIIRTVLSAEFYVPLEELEEDLYYSESAIKKDLTAAKRWLQKFDLMLKLKKTYGYYIEGNEWKKRLALLAQDKIFMNLLPKQRQKEQEYLRVLQIESRPLWNLRPKFMQYIRENPHIIFPALDFPVVSNYIVLIATRQKYQDQLYFTEEQKEALDQSGLLRDAEEILSLYKDEIKVTEAEVRAFAMLLLAYRSITDKSQITVSEQSALDAQIGEIHAVLCKRMDLEGVLDSEFDTALALQWYGIRNKILFGIQPSDEYVRPYIVPNLLALDLCIEVEKYAAGKFQKAVGDAQFYAIYYLMRDLVEKKMAGTFQYHIAVSSLYGYAYAESIARRIKEEYSFYIKGTTALEFTQLEGTAERDYDFLVTDLWNRMVPEAWREKILDFKPQKNQDQSVPELASYFEREYERSKEVLLTQKTIQTGGLKKRDLLLLLARETAALADSEETIERLSEREKYLRRTSESDTVFLTCWQEENEDFVRIYDCSAKVRWGNGFIRRIICYSYSGRNPETLFYIDRILKELIK